MKVQLDSIKSRIRRGDITTVASIVGCSPDTVRRMVIEPEDSKYHRSIDTEVGKKVIDAFQIIFNTRDHLRRKYANHKVA